MALRLATKNLVRRSFQHVSPLPTRTLHNQRRKFFSSKSIKIKSNVKNTFDKLNATLPPKFQLPKYKDIDWGAVIMNVGAVSGLAGFMMSDVMYLRLLSICGSLCGVGYNITRTPRQINACLWGGVFISTNLVMIMQLIRERNAELPKFNVEELHLWQR